MGLDTKKLDEILHLMSILILLDGKIFPEEVEVMGQQAFRLCKMIDDRILLTPDMAKNWFVSNQRQIGLTLASQDRQRAIISSVTRLAGLNSAFQQKLIYAMLRIAWADGEYHPEEEDYIHLAAKAWGLAPPGLYRQQA